jgi:integrase
MASTQGIRTRHSRTCPANTNRDARSVGKPKCEPTYEAWVYSKRDRKKIYASFPTLAAARGWRTDAQKAVKDKKLRAPTSRTLRQEVDEWLAGARAGEVRNKRGAVYKPAVIRNYELALRLRVLDELGDRKLADIGLADLLGLKERLSGVGCSDSTIRNTFVPLQAIYRRARRMGYVAINPTLDLGLPTAGRRERAATPTQAAELLEALSEFERAMWATAFYAGLRRGELRALRVRDVDFDAATIRVERGWDDKAGPIEPKSRAGTRQVFMLETLRPFLEALARGHHQPEALLFGLTATTAFEPKNIARKAKAAWKAENDRRAKAEQPLVEWFGFHEARHTFATFLDHAGISETRADRYLGHSLGQMNYRHLLAEQIAEDAQRVDAYLSGALAGKVVELKRPAVG